MMKDEMKVGIQTDVIWFGGLEQTVHSRDPPQLQERIPTRTVWVCRDKR